MTTRLFVGNLSYDTTEDSLGAAFGADGRNVRRVSILLDRETGRPRGFGFVDMATDEDAHAAIAAMDGFELDGRSLRVDIAKERQAGPGGGDRGPRPDAGRRGGSDRGGPPPRRDGGGDRPPRREFRDEGRPPREERSFDGDRGGADRGGSDRGGGDRAAGDRGAGDRGGSDRSGGDRPAPSRDRPRQFRRDDAPPRGGGWDDPSPPSRGGPKRGGNKKGRKGRGGDDDSFGAWDGNFDSLSDDFDDEY